jgi:hypothetical protein
MRRILTVALLLALAVPASAQQFFDFNGQVNLPAGVGQDLDMVAQIFDAAPATTPVPLDFANFEYTLVVTGLTLDTDASTQLYSGGTIRIYEDSATASDFNNPASFSDGTVVLEGDLVSLQRTLLFGSIGTVNGIVNWTGGASIGLITPLDRLNWAFVSGSNGGSAEPGYDEEWDGKVEPQEEIVATEEVSVGSLKSRF